MNILFWDIPRSDAVYGVGKSIYTSEYKRLTGLIRSAREKSGITQSELAKALGKQQSYVSKYEAGERRLDLVELAEICEALRISLVTLVTKFQAKRARR